MSFIQQGKKTQPWPPSSFWSANILNRKKPGWPSKKLTKLVGK